MDNHHKGSTSAVSLDLDTMDRLRGTVDVRKRLLIEMSTGTPSISDIAYAIKARIKDDFKIVSKVLKKRNQGKSGYNVSDIRDVVGLRIITLFRLDALNVVPLLLAKIQESAGRPDSVFMSDGVEEVKIYSTNPNGDAQALSSRLNAEFDARGYGSVTTVEQTPSNYTSVHMVVWCRGRYRSSHRNIPVEIQIRTAFEDAWGEIDHKLKYKRDIIDISDGVNAQFDEIRLGNTLSHLNIMKTFVDGVAQYADQIKIQLDEIDDYRLKSRASRPAENSLDLLNNISGVTGELRADLKNSSI